MTKTRAPISVDSILAILKDGPRKVEELRTLTGYSRSGVAGLLERMNVAGQVRRESVEIPTASGYCYVWHACSGQEDSSSYDDHLFIPGAMPKQKTVRQYEPICRRDPLVAALFGEAK